MSGEQSHKSSKDKKLLKAESDQQIGPTPSEFWTKVDNSIEETKRISKQFKSDVPADPQPRLNKDGHAEC